MITGAKGRQRIPEIAVVAVVYLVSLTSSFLFLVQALQADSGLPTFGNRLAVGLLTLLPLGFFAIFLLSLGRSLRQLVRNEWGARLRLKLIILFVTAITLSVLPPTLALSMLTIRAVELPSSKALQSAIDSSFELALANYEEQENRLRSLGSLLATESIQKFGPDAALILEHLQRYDPGIGAVELRSGQTTLSFAGPEEIRSPERTFPASDKSLLPKVATNTGTWNRFLVKNAGYDSAGQAIAMIIAQRAPVVLEETARKLSQARTSLGSLGGNSLPIRHYLLLFVLVYILPLLTLALLYALAAGDLLLRPLMSLDAAFRRVRNGQTQIKLLTRQGDEAGMLMETFNMMLTTLERNRDDDVRNEKIGVWRDIARRLAHELRNPLTPIKLSAERVLRRYHNDPASVGEILEKSMIAIVQETSNMENLLTEFQSFARLPEAQKNWLRLAELVQETVLLYSASYPRMQFDISQVAADLTLKADRGYLKQALGNLITNAADATNQQGRVEIQADLVKTADSRYCRIQLRDDGHGIPPELAAKIFSPYFTTKEHGTGLGLAVVEHVVNSHGGTIRLESAPGLGTVFYIDLPVDLPEQAPEPRA